VACGAGAGLAAVYNVPLSGALFTLEVLLCSARPRHVVPAALSSAVASCSRRHWRASRDAADDAVLDGCQVVTVL